MTQNKQTPAAAATHAKLFPPGELSSLTEEQFTALLAGESGHPDGAEGAPEEVLHLQTALRSYRSETIQWAERRSAGQPSLERAARRSERWAALPRWSLATVALVTLAGGVAHLQGSGTTTDEPALNAVAPASIEPATPTDIAADNRLLSSINDELRYHSASPADSLGLRDSKQYLSPATTSGATE